MNKSKENNLKEIGGRIKKARESANMTQAELAEKISSLRETVAYYETGQRDIKTGTLMRLAKTLGVSSDYLLGLSDVPTTDRDLQYVCDYIGFKNKNVITFLHEERKTPAGGLFNDYICDLIDTLSCYDNMIPILAYKIGEEKIYQIYAKLHETKNKTPHEDSDNDTDEDAELVLYFQALQSKIFQILTDIVYKNDLSEKLNILNDDFSIFGLEGQITNYKGRTYGKHTGMPE